MPAWFHLIFIVLIASCNITACDTIYKESVNENAQSMQVVWILTLVVLNKFNNCKCRDRKPNWLRRMDLVKCGKKCEEL